MNDANYCLTASLNAFPALNLGAFEAGTSIGSPVRGLRAVRAALAVIEKVPKPTKLTDPPLASVDVIAASIASTALLASDLLSSVSAATWLIKSALFIGSPEID